MVSVVSVGSTTKVAHIYFWKQHWDGSVDSLACHSRRPYSHPNQHTEAELKLIRDMRRRNLTLGLVELWHRLYKRGYIYRLESFFRVIQKIGCFLQKSTKTLINQSLTSK